MHWAHSLIGLPWTVERNCWHFVRQVFRDQWGVVLPEITESGNAHTIRTASHDTSLRPLPLDAKPQEGDLVIMRSQIKLHAGIVVHANGHTGVLHSTSATGVIWQNWHEAIEGTTAQLWRRHV